MRCLAENEVAIQIWSDDNPQANSLSWLVKKITNDLSKQSNLGLVTEVEGPTAHIPDYFSDLYGTVLGWLIYVADTDPKLLKEFVMMYEEGENGRLADIDVFTSYFDKISRKDLVNREIR